MNTTNISANDLALLAYLLEDEASAAAPAQKIPQRENPGAAPLSFAQQRLWFLDQLEPGQAAYNIPLALRLSGALQIAPFERALSEIIRRHDILRTTYQALDAQPVQVISKFEPVALPVCDLSLLPAAVQENEIARLVREDAQRPFALAQGPVWRATLLRRHATEHVFLWNVHHIASDAWSTEVFFRELAALYTAFSNGQPSPLRDLPIQYADFAAWQRQWLTGEILESQLAYWRRQLAGAPPILELPVDRPRPAIQTFSGAFAAFSLSREITEALQQLSQQHHVTLFMTLLAAFKALLSRYTGRHDILVGCPIANRTRAEIEDLIGFFVNTLVLRTDLGANPTFAELLARVNEVALAAYAHQDVPFEKLVEELQPQRDLGVSPFFQVMFIYQQHGGLDQAGFSGLQLRPLESYSGMAKFDLTLALYNRPEGLAGAIEYNTDLFEAATIRRLIGHFERLLENLAAHPDRRIAELPMLAEPEKRQLLVTWNDSKKEYPREVCFHHLFEAQAARTPEAVAVVFENQQLTYGELNRRANQLAHHLRKLGVGPDVLVGLCVERSLEMVVGVLGILKAGGAYVPLDPAYPPERLAYVLADAQTPVLLTQKSLILDFEFSTENLKLICLDADWKTLAAESPANPGVAVVPENLVYVIYTSGSTGKPKGVAIPQQALVNFLLAMQQAPGLAAADALLSVTTLSFDIAALEIYLPLITGARLIIAAHETAKDGLRLMAQLAGEQASVMQATPATWRLLLESGWPGHPALKILCGGEALPRDLAEKLLAKSAALWNMYGPTETTIWSGAYRLTSVQGSAPIGHPIANTQFYILDAHLQVTPVGVPGELHIGGDGLARGYLNRPELHAEKFIPHPFLPARTEAAAAGSPPAARLYKTGDRARYLADGSIEFLGRVDQQVKLRGFRIELGEIEATLNENPAVRQSAVIIRADIPDDPRLVSYIVPNGTPVPAPDELQRFLQNKLPDYMIPAVFVTLAALPLTPNGKVDRKALPTPEAATSTGAGSYVAPRNATEEALSQIWQELLPAAPPGIYDDFFRSGGHSLAAARFISRVRAHFGVEVALQAFFRFPTIAQLAEHVETALLARFSNAEIDAMLETLDDLDEASAQRLLGV